MLVRGSGPTETMSKYLIRRIEQTRNVSLLTHTEIAGLEGGDHLERITWRNHEFGTTRESESLTFL
jgi:thioredoxin reductase (NADPH)